MEKEAVIPKHIYIWGPNRHRRIYLYIHITLVCFVLLGEKKNHYNQKQLREGRGYLTYTSTSVHHWAGTEAENIEEYCFLSCSYIFLILLSYTDPRPPFQGQHFPQWAGPSQQSLIKKMPCRLTYSQYDEGIYSGFSSLVMCVCVCICLDVSVWVSLCVSVCLWVCVCVQEQLKEEEVMKLKQGKI